MTGQESAHMSMELTEITNQISLNGKEAAEPAAPPVKVPPKEPQPVVHKSPSQVCQIYIILPDSFCTIIFLHDS